MSEQPVPKIAYISQDVVVFGEVSKQLREQRILAFRAASALAARIIADEHPTETSIAIATKISDSDFEKVVRNIEKVGNEALKVFILPGIFPPNYKEALIKEKRFIVPLQCATTHSEKICSEITRYLGQKKAQAYDAKVLASIVGCVSQVIEYYTNKRPAPGKAGLKKADVVPPFLTGISTLSGQEAQGFMALGVDKQFITSVATRVSGRPKSEVMEDITITKSVTSELCDQIFGKARVDLGELGYQLKVSLPTVLTADEQQKFAQKSAVPVLSIPFTLNNNNFFIDFCFGAKK